MAGGSNWVGLTSTDLGYVGNWSGGLPTSGTSASTMGTGTFYPALGACNGLGMTLSGGTNARIDGGAWYCPVTISNTAVNTGIRGGVFLGSVSVGGGGRITAVSSTPVFLGAVSNSGTISAGIFYGPVTNNAGGTISGGTFYGAVTNNGTISGGTFNVVNGVLATGQGKSGYTYFVVGANADGVITDVAGGTFIVPAASNVAASLASWGSPAYPKGPGTFPAGGGSSVIGSGIITPVRRAA